MAKQVIQLDYGSSRRPNPVTGISAHNVVFGFFGVLVGLFGCLLLFIGIATICSGGTSLGYVSDRQNFRDACLCTIVGIVCLVACFRWCGITLRRKK